MLGSKKEFQKSFLYQSCNDMADICKPLKNHFDIDYFAVQFEFINWETNKIENVSLWNSSTNFDTFYDYYKSIGNYKIDITTTLRQYHNYHGKFLVDTPEVAAFAQKNYNIFNTLRKTEKINNEEWIRYCFATSSNDSKYLNFYLNNQDLLNKFILYFKDRAAPLIKKARSGPAFIEEMTNQPGKDARVNVVGATQSFDNRSEFIKVIEPKHQRILNKNGEIVSVPNAEMECLKLLARGRSAKEIANILNISSRTVESNFTISKQRLQCFSRKDLLDVLEKNNL